MSRPVAVTWLALAVLILSAANLLRAAQVWLRLAYLAELDLSVAPFYLGASGLVWGILLGAAGFGLWRTRPWGRRLALATVCLLHLHAWINRLIFETSDYARQVWPWEAAASAIGVALTWGILGWPSVRTAFKPRRDARRVS